MSVTVDTTRPAPPEPDRPAPARAPRRPGESTVTSRIIVVAVLAIVAVYFLVPVYWLVVAATKNSTDLFGSGGLWFSNPQLLENLRQLFVYEGSIYVRWLLNSALYAGVGAFLATLLSAAAGYGMGKFVFPGRNAVFNLILAGVLIPGTALALPLYLLLSQVNLVNTYWAVLLPSLVSPFGVFLCRIYAAASVPDSLLEAARIDGAGEARIFRTLGLRIMTPALVTVFLFQFVAIWNNFFLPLVMLSDPSLYPITLGLQTWYYATERAPELYQHTVGGAFVSIIPLMIAMAALQRFWRTGLTEGSVKT